MRKSKVREKPSPLGWADGNTSPTRTRGVETIPRLRVGLVLKPLVQLLAAISSGPPSTPSPFIKGEEEK